nr:GGDEF domain-containing protein [Gammaproteobacteria bacterium]
LEDKHAITLSFGIVQFNLDRHSTTGVLFDEADQAMLQAKQKGRNCSVYH